jgi:hypothetical protein
VNTRIRYNKPNNGVLRSRRHFTTLAGREVVVELDLNQKKYKVLDSMSGEEVLSGGDTVNPSVLKIQAKQGLMNLGVSFSDETRTRGQNE